MMRVGESLHMPSQYIFLLDSPSPNLIPIFESLQKERCVYVLFKHKKAHKFRLENNPAKNLEVIQYKDLPSILFNAYIHKVRVNFILGGWPKSVFDLLILLFSKISNSKLFNISERSIYIATSSLFMRKIAGVFIQFSFDGVLAIGTKWSHDIARLSNLKTIEISYAVDLKPLASFPTNSTIKRKTKTLKVITISRLIPSKNVKSVISFCNSLVPFWDSIELTIVGDGPLFNELQHYSSKFDGLHLTFAGYQPRENIFKLLMKSDLFLFLPVNEGWGVAPVEASLCGLPLIVSADVPSVTSFFASTDWTLQIEQSGNISFDKINQFITRSLEIDRNLIAFESRQLVPTEKALACKIQQFIESTR